MTTVERVIEDAIAQQVGAVSAALEVLSTKGTPEGIAAYLRAEGFTGVRDDVADCVIAHYLEAATGAAVWVQPFLDQTGVVEILGVATVPMPGAVNGLALRFDAGECPELEKAAI